jgi:HK97 gp10 family phage protein
MTIEVQIEGLADLVATMQQLPDKLRKRALRNSLAAGARVVRDAARAKRRADSATSSILNTSSVPWRHGTVEKAISVRTSKESRRAGDVGVFVNVKPVHPGGRDDPNDPFYWRWLEFGSTRMGRPYKPFLKPAANMLSQALDVFTAEFGKQLQKLDANPKDPL